ncbi:hypothetical protein Vafri_13650, partial [Volvox africanus]
TGRVAESWELLPEIPPHLLLPPLQPEPAALQEPAHWRSVMEVEPALNAEVTVDTAVGPLESRAGHQPLLSCLLMRRRTLAAPLATGAAAQPPHEPPPEHRHRHHRRRPTLNPDLGIAGEPSPLAAGVTTAATAASGTGIELQPRVQQSSQSPRHPQPPSASYLFARLPPAPPVPQPPSRHVALAQMASLARGTGGAAGAAALPGLPVTLSLAPIELDVDYE